jgi:hypothetical protein
MLRKIVRKIKCFDWKKYIFAEEQYKRFHKGKKGNRR